MSFPIQIQALTSIFSVRTQNGQGTCFYHVDGNDYAFISAAHLFIGVAVGDTVFLATNDAETAHQVLEIAASPEGPDVDVCAFTLSDPPALECSVQTDPNSQISYGEELRFIGYPHGLNVGAIAGNDRPFGLIRSAVFSGVISKNGAKVWILDGFNNPGYSGAPVFRKMPNGRLAWAAVISGFRFERPEFGRVFGRDEEGNETPTDYFVKGNSGMIMAFGTMEILNASRALAERYHSTD